MARQSLERTLVTRGLCSSIDDAVNLIEAGRVRVSGSVALNVKRQVRSSEPILIENLDSGFVGRGGEKLAAALAAFTLDVVGRSAIDAGSATGGFTDSLLRSGAAKVLAVDVGYGQLHERLRSDDRVVSLERTNIRELSRGKVEELCAPLPGPTLLTADLSFSSLTTFVDHFAELLGGSGDLVMLCKPQFEVTRNIASKRQGVIRENDERQETVVGVCRSFRAAGYGIRGVVNSPILGPAGNAEFLIHSALDAARDAVDIEQQIEQAIENAGAL